MFVLMDIIKELQKHSSSSLKEKFEIIDKINLPFDVLEEINLHITRIVKNYMYTPNIKNESRIK